MPKMITTHHKATHEASTTVVPFELKLPTELDPKPKFVVPVSKFIEAHVYEDVKATTREGKEVVLHCFRILLVDTRTGVFTSRYLHPGHSYNSVLDVKIQLQELAAQLAPRVRRSVEREEDY